MKTLLIILIMFVSGISHAEPYSQKMPFEKLVRKPKYTVNKSLVFANLEQPNSYIRYGANNETICIGTDKKRSQEIIKLGQLIPEILSDLCIRVRKDSTHQKIGELYMKLDPFTVYP